MTLEVEGFHDLRREVERLANNFEEMSRKHDRDTVREAIEKGVTNAFQNSIVPDAKRGASRIGLPSSHVSTIREESRGWDGDRYSHDLRSNSVIIASHEFGSGLYSMNGRGTVDVEGEGYYIPKPRSKGPIRLTGHPDDTDDSPVIVEYVVHPGVRPKRFMHEALMDNENVIRGSVGGQLSSIMRKRGLID